MQRTNKLRFSVVMLVGAALFAGCSAPSASTNAAKSDTSPATIAPPGAGSTSRDQNLKNMPADVRARLESQGQLK